MKVTPFELDVTPSSVAEPVPVYKDQLITVYGVPLPAAPPEQDSQPPLSEAPATDESTAGKRKRSRSPVPIPKRQKTAWRHVSSQASESEELTLLQRQNDPDFFPHTLNGQEAQEWRCLVLDSMFPNTNGNSQAQPAKGKGKQLQLPPENMLEVGATSGASVDPKTSTSTVIGYRAKDRRLPPMRGANPSNRYCYVCVGPKVRGKFDVEKSLQLGIPRGPL